MDNCQLWGCGKIVVKKRGEEDGIRKGCAKVVKQEKIRPKFLNSKKSFAGIVKKPDRFREVDEGCGNLKVKAGSKQKLSQDIEKKQDWVLNKDLAMEFSLVSMLNYLKSTYNFE